MDIANLVTSGNFWSIHTSFDTNRECAPVNYWDSLGTENDGDDTDIDDVVAAGYQESESSSISAKPLQGFTESEEDTGDSDHEGEEDTDTEEEEGFTEPNSMTHMMLLSSSAAGVQQELEPRLQYTQQLIKSFMVDPQKESSHLSEEIHGTRKQAVSVDEEVSEFPEDVPARVEVEEPLVERCFDSIPLVSNKCLTAVTDSEVREHLVALPSPDVKVRMTRNLLSGMIHPMNVTMFPSPANKHMEELPRNFEEHDSNRGIEDTSTIASVCPTRMTSWNAHRSPTSILQMEQYRILSPIDGQKSENSSSRLASGFRSSVQDGRMHYHLGTGKQGMSFTQKLEYKTFLSKRSTKENRQVEKINESNDEEIDDHEEDDTGSRDTQSLMPSIYSVERCSPARSPSREPNPCPSTKTCLSILLVDIRLKIFEIVVVDHVTNETSVGDVLSKARLNATDSRLSQQTYISLCNAINELAAPMLPVIFIVSDEADNPGDDPSLGRLLLAVPEGSSAAQVRRIQRALWSHPRIQRWWKSENGRA